MAPVKARFLWKHILFGIFISFSGLSAQTVPPQLTKRICTVEEYVKGMDEVYQIHTKASPKSKYHLTSYLYYRARTEELKSEYQVISRWYFFERDQAFKRFAGAAELALQYWGLVLGDSEVSRSLSVIHLQEICLKEVMTHSTSKEILGGVSKLLEGGDSQRVAFINARLREDLFQFRDIRQLN